MANKRNRLRDGFTVVATSTVQAPNGDLVETVDSETVYRCAISSREQMLLDRTYEVPQLAFDYVLECRAETIVSASLDTAARVKTSKTGNQLFQVVSVTPDTLRKTRIFIKSSKA